MEAFRPVAQAKMDAVTQAATRRMAWGLVVANLVLGVFHQATEPWEHLRALLPLALLSSLSLVAMALWLRHPRHHTHVRMCEGTAALLAAATSLLDIALRGGPGDTAELMLIQVGAGFFLLSTYWWGLTAGLVLGGWGWVAFRAQDYALAVPLVAATLLGLLLHTSRRRVLRDSVDLEMRSLAAQAEQRQLMEELQAAMDSIRTLRGLIPICAKCKKIRDDQGYWQQVEVFVEAHSHAAFSHGLCPHCLALVKAEWAREFPG